MARIGFRKAKYNPIDGDKYKALTGSKVPDFEEGTVYPLEKEVNGLAVGTWEKHQTFATLAEAETYLDGLLTPTT